MIVRLRDLYGIPAEALSYVPVGEYAACYAVGAGRERFFLKIWPPPVPEYVTTQSLVAMLRLTREMHERRLFQQLSYPLAMRDGGLSWTVAGRLFALFPFIAGRAPAASAAFAAELGRGMARVHRATAALADVLPSRRDTLSILFEGSLREQLDKVAAIGPGDRPGLIALRERILPIRDDVLAMLDRLHRLEETVRAIDVPFALCHRDLGTHNCLADADGRVFFIDWDDVAMAPAEHDVFAGRGPWFRNASMPMRRGAGCGRSMSIISPTCSGAGSSTTCTGACARRSPTPRPRRRPISSTASTAGCCPNGGRARRRWRRWPTRSASPGSTAPRRPRVIPRYQPRKLTHCLPSEPVLR
jgi:hypothetical protein